MTSPIYQEVGLENDQDGKTADLSQEQLDASRRKTRIKAATLIAVFLAISLAPYPWNIFAPLLLILPLIASVAERLRRSRSPADALPDNASVAVEAPLGAVKDPYSCISKDPHDPRKYKPIQ